MTQSRTADTSIAAAPVRGGAWVHAIFLCAAATSGVLFYLLSQSLQPVLANAGVDGIWLDACLFVGGFVGLWLALSPQPPSQPSEAVAQN